MKINKKGLSPIITTVLLIVIALVLASIIFMWASGFGKEQVAKFGEPIEQVCSEVVISGSISGGKVVSVINQGEVPIYKLRFLISGGGNSDKEDIEVNLVGGASKSVTLTSDATGREVEMIPVLLGTVVSDESTTEEYPCTNVAQTLFE
ncbi:MAG: hypothetical protein Q8L27_03310 [archaeon]|nr:hypothetical protein [archaeon]